MCGRIRYRKRKGVSISAQRRQASITFPLRNSREVITCHLSVKYEIIIKIVKAVAFDYPAPGAIVDGVGCRRAEGGFFLLIPDV